VSYRPLAGIPSFKLLAAATSAAFFLACAGGGDRAADGLSGSIAGDGSSTVFPITEAMAEEFGNAHKDVEVTVGISGTGGGFEKFCAGETDFSNASRKIKDEEKQACAANGIEHVEFQVAFDGLSVIVNLANDFAECLTVDELASIWKADSSVESWSDVRADFPDEPLAGHLYGPGTDSGTFDYFTKEINGEEGSSRADYTASEDDNVLVQGIAGDDTALGYFGFAYYENNQDKLKLLDVDDGAGCVTPSRESILDGTYSPLSRPLFVYVAKDALARPEVAEFMRFFLTDGVPLVSEVGYVEATDDIYQDGLALIP
jgi:phosphate transport system substrate-binding protein